MKLVITSAIRNNCVEEVKYKESNILQKLAEKYFDDKSYCPEVENYRILWESTPPKYMLFFVQRRPKYTFDKLFIPRISATPPFRIQKELVITVQVPFAEYSVQDTKIGGWNVIGKAILAYLREMKYPVVLRKKFDRERFNSDMEAFFLSVGCTLE